LVAVEVRGVPKIGRKLGRRSLAEKSEAHAVSNREMPRRRETARREVDGRGMVF